MSDIGLTEAHVQQTVTEFLQLEGWRAIRTDPVSDRKRGKGFGEVGMPDYLYVRYGIRHGDGSWMGSQADVLWIEFKRPRQHPTKEQIVWHAVERGRGALVLVIDDINLFIAWYKNSGLGRRV